MAPVLLSFCVCAHTFVWGQRQQTLTLDDLFKLENIWAGMTTVAPDGKMFAFVRDRPILPPAGPYRNWHTRKAVWVAPVGTGAAIRITNEADETGYMYPTWSPDGERLAISSVKADESYRLSLWDRASGRITELTQRLMVGGQFAWLDNMHLVAVMYPERSAPDSEALSQNEATGQWLKRQEGRTSTVSVLDSGLVDDPQQRPQREVMLIDVGSGVARTLGRAPTFEGLRVAPSGGHAAIFKEAGRKLPTVDSLGREEFGRFYQLLVVEVNGRVVPVETGSGLLPVPGSFEWSMDGREFAFFARTPENDGAVRVVRGMVDGNVSVLRWPDGVEAHKLVWANEGRLLVESEQEVHIAGKAMKRGDWWEVTSTGGPRNVSEKLKAAPSDLLAVSEGKALIGIIAGELWRLDVATDRWSNITASLDPPVAGISWPQANTECGRIANQIIVSVAQGMVTDYYQLDVLSGSAIRLARPSDEANLIGYSPQADTAIFLDDGEKGTSLMVVQSDKMHTVAETNQFLSGLTAGKLQKIEYTCADGQKLKAWLLFPTNYKAGTRYPMLTWVYAGLIQGDNPPALLSKLSPLNMQFLAARGYAVLFPSMPLKPEGQASDPLLDLTKGVIPAVEKAVELGIADPQRLAVAGHSYGGYSTYGLIGQTNRFRAAIASAGLTDLIGGYGMFSPLTRYWLEPQLYNSFVWWSERGQARMGNPPWKDWGRYMRNSPLFYVDRVETPLLIIHGDMDFVQIEQAEEFFEALYRQGKRARFLRYWGEGHGPSSPANIRNMWAHIYAWLDEFCDVTRDNKGDLVFDGNKVKSRDGGSPLKPEDFERFDDLLRRQRQRNLE